MELARSVAFFALTAVSLWSFLPASGSNDALDCCLRTSHVPIPRKIVLDYVVQRIPDGCPIHAVVFITVRGKQLCAPPHAHWVRRLTERLDSVYQSKKNLWSK
ncbi:C-C motif chemokine 19-like [Gopherus evgoodei]|uniref:C-C motif chemokine 19-like n=1 Tax=Gopherus evgoodei TaxID=1825980 RepID=UPI0011CF4DD7|nr:C-C motif chemokine 19-like [Gopherus evgoodei]